MNKPFISGSLCSSFLLAGCCYDGVMVSSKALGKLACESDCRDSTFILGPCSGCDILIKYSSHSGVELLRVSSILHSLGCM